MTRRDGGVDKHDTIEDKREEFARFADPIVERLIEDVPGIEVTSVLLGGSSMMAGYGGFVWSRDAGAAAFGDRDCQSAIDRVQVVLPLRDLDGQCPRLEVYLRQDVIEPPWCHQLMSLSNLEMISRAIRSLSSRASLEAMALLLAPNPSLVRLCLQVLAVGVVGWVALANVSIATSFASWRR